MNDVRMSDVRRTRLETVASRYNINSGPAPPHVLV